MFIEQLRSGWDAGKLVCLGLDPDPSRLPFQLRDDPVKGIIEFNEQVIEATADIVLAYKPQSAYYESLGLEGRVLKTTIDLVRKYAPGVPLVLDAKRADIGSTNDAYARTVFDFYGADAVTVNPYLGPETMAPFLERKDRGVIVLCRTSNPGASHYQNLQTADGTPLYQHIARDVAEAWNFNGNCALVVGATAPEELRQVRAIAPDLPILVPGIGTQGETRATLEAGADATGGGLLISSSRALMYAFEKHPDLATGEAARNETLALQRRIDEVRHMN